MSRRNEPCGAKNPQVIQFLKSVWEGEEDIRKPLECMRIYKHKGNHRGYTNRDTVEWPNE